MPYRYDVFLSYARYGPAGEWARDTFGALLKTRLEAEVGRLPVFVDEISIKPGQNWRNEVPSAIRDSRVMVSVLSPLYFQSAWCRSEWKSMRERQRVTGKETVLCPVRFSDGKYYPAEAQSGEWIDLEPFSLTAPAFKQSLQYVDFERVVMTIAKLLAEYIETAPDWREDFPIILEEETAPTAPSRPRF